MGFPSLYAHDMVIIMAKKKVTWHPEFGPAYTPEEMLEQGVFEGKYINNIRDIPASWKKLPKVVGPSEEPNVELNKFKIKSRQGLSEWKKKGWIMTDSNGWFHWYIKYYFGRRLGKEDETEIKRWKSFVARHQGQIIANCKPGDKECRPKQRQGLLQWAWDSSKPFTPEQVKRNQTKILKGLSGVVLEEVSEESLIELPPSAHW
jgi:hypothetical protein